MAPPAYKKNNRQAKMWAGFCFLGVIGQVVAVCLVGMTGFSKSHGGWALVFCILPLVIAIAISFKLTSRMNRERVKEIAVALEGIGFHLAQTPNETDRANFAAPLEYVMPMLGLKTAAAGIQWWALEKAAGSSALLFEHEFTTGTGKHTLDHHHTVVAWPAGHPQVRDLGVNTNAWFSMARHPLVQNALPDEMNTVEFTEIAKQWSFAGDARIGRNFLNPATRAALVLSPAHEGWFLGAGWACCYYKGTFDAQNVERFIAHARCAVAR